MKKTSGLSTKQSKELLKKLLWKKWSVNKAIKIAGNIILSGYNAKYDEKPYDAMPLFMVLRPGLSHTLGLNFHWLPVNMRMFLIQHIIKINKNNIKKKKPLVFSYKQLKPFLRRFNYAPCVRLYINTRLAKKGVLIPPEHIVDAARMNTAVFTGISPEQAYALATKRYLKRKKR